MLDSVGEHASDFLRVVRFASDVTSRSRNEVHLRVRFFVSVLLYLSALIALPAVAQQSARVAPADILILRAKVYTLNPQSPWAQAIAIRHGKIVAVGSEETVGKMRGIGTRVIDAGENSFFPALPIAMFIFTRDLWPSAKSVSTVSPP